MAEQWISASVMFAIVSVAGDRIAPIGGWIELIALLSLGGGTYFGVLFVISKHFRTTAWSVFSDITPTS
ncbi:hypothetical protein [Halolamina rubra]|uniref:hypothetical protein n=1 Tax=Halolamina rubra TaxID=1380430 RepID=UPI0006791A66|nr:hypothetical protein [Halolamina rubra]